METGTVKWFNNSKGYGFIQIDGRNGKSKEKTDVFVHFSQIISEGYKELREGQRVEFEIGHTAKGEQAEQVVVL